MKYLKALKQNIFFGGGCMLLGSLFSQDQEDILTMWRNSNRAGGSTSGRLEVVSDGNAATTALCRILPQISEG